MSSPSLDFRKGNRGAGDGRFVMTCQLWLPKGRDEVFPFFADAHNLQQLTPPWLRFNVLTPAPIEMVEGRLIDYKLKIRGVPIRWRSEITAWEPPSRFVDEQRRGPYKLWRHEHRFTEKDGGVLVEDIVHYDVYGGALVESLLVRPDIARIFRYRSSALSEIFAEGRAA